MHVTHERRIYHGICRDCGKFPAIQDMTICGSCRQNKVDYWKANKERWNVGRRAKHQQLRREVFEAYGGAFCACCGETAMEFLSINHVNGDGAKHRREMGWRDGSGGGGGNIYGYLKTRNFPPGFNVLCMNCNFAIGHRGYCPHQQQEMH